MDHLSDDVLIERIYEASVVPGAWKLVLDEMAKRVDAAGTGLFLISNQSVPSAIWSDAIDDVCRKYIEGGWQSKTQRAPRMMALNHAGFVGDLDIYGPGEIERDEAFANFLKPSGYGYGAGTGIQMPTGEVAVFSIERLYETGPLTRDECQSLDPLRPHLARASLLSVRASIERARSMTGVLESLALPSAVIRPNGHLLVANRLFESLMPHIVYEGKTRVQLSSHSADALLEEALQANRSGIFGRAVGSFPIGSKDGAVPMIAHLVPVQGEAQDVFLSGSVILTVTPVDATAVPSTTVLQGLFDLTPAEAKVAQAIAAAQSVEDISQANGVAVGTVRAQLKKVLSKTGVNRQVELAYLLAGKTIPLR